MNLSRGSRHLLWRFTRAGARRCRTLSSGPSSSGVRPVQYKSDASALLASGVPEKLELKAFENAVASRPRPTTVCIHNVPPHIDLSEVTRLVLYGPLLCVYDKEQNGYRTVSLTFFRHDIASLFYDEITATDVFLYGFKLVFAWANGPEPPPFTHTRALCISEPQYFGLSTAAHIHAQLDPYGPIDRVHFLQGRDAVFVDFCAVTSAEQALAALRARGAPVDFAHDHCAAAGEARASAIQNRSRVVVLDDVPAGTTVADLCNLIRGGALEKIVLTPARDGEASAAFVTFMEPTAAAAFYRFAVYRGLDVQGRRLSPRFRRNAGGRPPHLSNYIRLGLSRCILLTDIPDLAHFTESKIWHDARHYGPIEQVTVSEPRRSASISFMNIQDAVAAHRQLPKRAGYAALKVGFKRDRCAAPFPGSQEAARLQHTQVAALFARAAPAAQRDSELDSVVMPPLPNLDVGEVVRPEGAAVRDELEMVALPEDDTTERLRPRF
ncbi:hypothetical protein B0H10DRAFT_2220327 [Mycena sp. CBHHK59/15]|nr:hypothetical protein B0H10DRAFT_2220327 [Mycena sp. CBHHK59/15]